MDYIDDNRRRAIEAFPSHFNCDNLLAREYNWGEPVDHLDAPFDVILVSDCILPKLYPIEILIAAVRAVMHAESKAYFSYEHRVFPEYDPRVEFKRLLEKYDLEMVSVPIEEQDEVYSCDDIEIWLVTMKSLSGSASVGRGEKEMYNADENLLIFSHSDLLQPTT